MWGGMIPTPSPQAHCKSKTTLTNLNLNVLNFRQKKETRLGLEAVGVEYFLRHFEVRNIYESPIKMLKEEKRLASGTLG